MKHVYSSKNLVLLLLLIFPVFIVAQTITGTITKDGSSEPVPFVNVIEKGTSNGAVADIDGSFTIEVQSLPTTLLFSSVGFETQEVSVTSAGNIQVTLAESAASLDEVVVTGLASSVKRENLANAVATVSAEELVGTTAQSTVDGALYGKIAGVNITSTSGAPGGGFALRLRGISSLLGNNQPLFIIDGVYYNNDEIPSGLRFASGANQGNEENSANRLADLDPNDIANIEVLKGASAAAIYGQRASAGVVIVTTKRGKSGKTSITFNQDTGINVAQNLLGLRPWTRQSVVDTFGEDEALIYDQAIAENGGLYDYEEEIYGETGLISDTRLSARGGGDKTRFFAGVGYRDEEGIIDRTGFDRLSIRANIDHKISDVFDFSLSSNYVRSSSSRSFTGNENEGGLSYGYTLAFTRPWYNLYPDENGNYPNNPTFSGNPVYVRDQTTNEDLNNRFLQGYAINTKIYTGEKNRVRLNISGGLDYLSNETFVSVPQEHQSQQAIGGFVAVGKNDITQFNNQVIGVWDHDAMGGDLALTTQLGTAYIDIERNFINTQGTDLLAGQTSVDNSVNQTVRQTRQKERDFSYFAQVEGNYKDQIIGTLGYRLDKSTRNGDPNEFYGFPKASVAVNFGNFDFWNEDALFNQFKFRAAYGEAGNPAAFGATFTSLTPTNIGGSGGVSVSGQRGDADIEPETSAEFETGLDIGILDSRVTLSATYYNRTVRDLLLQRNLPGSSGFTSQTTNLAELVNQGVEVVIGADILRQENVFWNSNLNFFLNRSEVTELNGPPTTVPGAGFGLGLGTFFLEEGESATRLVGNLDLDGDGVTEPTEIGDVEPDFQIGWSNQFTFFKQLDLSFLFQWKEGNENINLSQLLTDLGQTTPDLETAAGQERLQQPINAARFVEDASYIRLREAAIYYRFTDSVVESIFGDEVSGLKLGFSGRNIFTITDYSSYDPEVSVNGGAGFSQGIEVTPFPSASQFYFHLNVNF